MRRVLLAILATSFLSIGSAFAQDAGGGDTGGGTGGKVEYKKKTVYDFEDDVVEGELVKPDGVIDTVRRKGKHSSLIKIREDFIPEMIKSVNDI